MKKGKSFWGTLVASVVIAGSFFLFSCCAGGKSSEDSSDLQAADTTKTDVVYKYGIPVEEYKVEFGVVEPNCHLAQIFSSLGISDDKIHKLTHDIDSIFDVRKMRSGQSYAVFRSKDSLSVPVFFVYEESPKDYVVFDLCDSCKVWRGMHPVEWKEKSVKGHVESSLWVAMEEQGVSPQMAMDLSGIFGWSIDFFGLQKEDEFRVIYEQEYVNGCGLPNFKILAASFKASDSLVYAIPFMQDGEELYYNENGNSLEGAFLKAPLDYYRISSKFTNSRFHPVLKRYRAHHGVDYAAPVGTPVYAIGEGRVIAKGYQSGGAGNFVKIKHNGSYTSTYMHLSRFAKGLNVGSVVRQKEVIGYVGSTGLSTGPHLDFRVYENGRPVNPLTIKSQPKKPISKENMDAFVHLRDSMVARLLSL